MKINKVTLTGADESVTPSSLIEISAKYPFVEWGILLSRKSAGGNRFPSVKWMDELAELVTAAPHKVKLSGHLCGAFVRETVMADMRFTEEIGDIWEYLERIQINTHGISHEYDYFNMADALNFFDNTEYIFQYDNVNREILDAAIRGKVNCSTLFDLSHGAGVLPENWPLPIEGLKCGYAGGLSPDNISAQMDAIATKVGDTEIWIDMETHIRSNNDSEFDLDKCVEVLEICKNSGYISA